MENMAVAAWPGWRGWTRDVRNEKSDVSRVPAKTGKSYARCGVRPNWDKQGRRIASYAEVGYPDRHANRVSERTIGTGYDQSVIASNTGRT